MKNLHMKSLATAVLIGGSLFASAGAIASIGTSAVPAAGGPPAAAPGAGVINSAGSSCEAYNAGQEEFLIANFSSMAATNQVWIHCPMNMPANSTFNTTGSMTMNVQMPISTTSTVYNCYVAQQGLASSSAATTNRTVVWARNSGVGNVSVGFGVDGSANGHLNGANTNLFGIGGMPAVVAPTGVNAPGTTYSYTSGCLLNTGDQLHSTQLNAL